MTNRPTDPVGFDWSDPRWRDPEDEPSAEKERERRFRDTAAPRQQGAVDGRSVNDDPEVADTP
jgi:hypothetical protein